MDNLLVPLANKKGRFVDYAYIDAEDEFVLKYKWYLYRGKTKKKYYVSTRINNDGKNIFTSLHQLIIGKIDKNSVIDHINGKVLDNTKANLRIVTRGQNGQNKKKKKNCESKFIGVTKRDNNRWNVKVAKKWVGVFENEIEAGYWYNIFAFHKYKKIFNFNKCYFVPSKATYEAMQKRLEIYDKKKRESKKYYYRKKQKIYIANIGFKGKKYYLGSFKTKEEAIAAYEKKQKELIGEYDKSIKEKKINRNENGLAIIEIKNNQGVKIAECIVDDDKWHNLIKCAWNIKEGYAHNQKIGLMQRYLLNAEKGVLIDHINKNRLDNRIENLRISDIQKNNHNRTKSANKSSKFIGVSKIYNGRFAAEINKNGIRYRLGVFKDEKDAALAYNNKAKELYGDYANLNQL